ncbi:hypothetical protein H9P43_007533 [Blastocladiella emersonii ATCC 22665]|nr:hypothetical protein H9P43_007533 [Blastocladiella emersonii ATCC 22665]
MAELHLIGTLQGAQVREAGQLTGGAGLACRWTVVSGTQWNTVEGCSTAQTHVDLPADGEWVVWSHPIDLHLATRSVQGWPKLAVELLRQDMFGRYQLIGYGIVSIPMTPGTHQLECPTWRPHGSFMDSLKAHFLGITPGLKSLESLYTAADRYKLTTASTGCDVFVELTVIPRGFSQHGMHL